MITAGSSAKRARARALKTGAASIALMLSAPALGQCVPEPTEENGVVTCTGVDGDGLNVTTYGTFVLVPQESTVLGSGGPAIAISPPSDTFGAPISLSISGLVDGGTKAGVELTLPPPPLEGYGYGSANLFMTIDQGSTVTGVTAVAIGRAAPSNMTAYVTIDNSGTLTGTDGLALVSTSPDTAFFSSIFNHETGTIGAISGPVGSLINYGKIDGGGRSAVDWGGSNGTVFGTISNTGTIRSASSASTLANIAPGRSLINQGTIAISALARRSPAIVLRSRTSRRA
jgi:hypothetical protein